MSTSMQTGILKDKVTGMSDVFQVDIVCIADVTWQENVILTLVLELYWLVLLNKRKN